MTPRQRLLTHGTCRSTLYGAAEARGVGLFCTVCTSVTGFGRPIIRRNLLENVYTQLRTCGTAASAPLLGCDLYCYSSCVSRSPIYKT